MKRRRESDASLWIGLVLGGVLGAATTVILSVASEPDTNFPRLNLRPQPDSNATRLGISTTPGSVASPDFTPGRSTAHVSVTPDAVSVTTTNPAPASSVSTNTVTPAAASGNVQEASKSLKENDEERTEGAAESAG